MVRYYDPLYQHTLPKRRLEVQVDDFEVGYRNLTAAIARLL